MKKQLTVVTLAALLSGCVSMGDIHGALEEAISRPLQYVEDAIRGYRVQYYTLPAGARIICAGEEIGVTPFVKYYDLTPEDKQRQLFKLPECQATWQSGAVTAVNGEVSLEKFPTNVQAVFERPKDYSGAESDEQYGIALVAERHRALQALASSISGAILASRERKNQSSSFDMSAFNMNFKPVTVPGQQIKWNWVSDMQAAPMPNFALNSISPRRNMTLVFPASSCVGTIVMGACHGKIVDPNPPRYCSGKMVNGECLGAVLW